MQSGLVIPLLVVFLRDIIPLLPYSFHLTRVRMEELLVESNDMLHTSVQTVRTSRPCTSTVPGTCSYGRTGGPYKYEYCTVRPVLERFTEL